MIAIGYARCSTRRQAESGLGLAGEEAAIREHCASKGWTLAAIHRDEGLSGSLPIDKRPGLLLALSELGDGDVLVVKDRSRLARDPLVSMLAERLAAGRGARIVSCAGEGSDLDGPTGTLIRAILDAVAQFERAQGQMRTRAAMAQRRQRGLYCGGPVRYGYRREGPNLVEDEDEQSAIRFAQDLHARHGSTLAGVATELDRHYTTRTGTPWHPQQVARLLKGNDR